MKKTYKNPSLTVVKIQPARILAGSDLYTKTGNATEWGARGSRFSADFWDEEEDYDE